MIQGKTFCCVVWMGLMSALLISHTGYAMGRDDIDLDTEIKRRVEMREERENKLADGGQYSHAERVKRQQVYVQTEMQERFRETIRQAEVVTEQTKNNNLWKFIVPTFLLGIVVFFILRAQGYFARE